MPPSLRSRLNEIAAAAGVSLSTVDRVLNERGGVSDAKRKKVIEAARAMGSRRHLPPPTKGTLHFDVLLTQDHTEHYGRVERALRQYGALLAPRVAVHRSVWLERDHQKMLAFIRKPGHRRHGLLVVIAQDAPDITSALSEATAAGVPTVLLSSIAASDRYVYVGIDNHAAGRTAAVLMGPRLSRPGRVALLSGSLTYLAHRERVAGFLEVMRERWPQFEIVGPLEIHDRVDLAQSTMRGVMDAPGDLVGVYGTCAASEGIRAALATRSSQAPSVTWIGHEATAEHEALVRSGMLSMVIDQDADAQVQAALQELLFANGDISMPPRRDQRFHIVTGENWPNHPEGI
jgi:LacI family transcriptional regulator